MPSTIDTAAPATKIATRRAEPRVRGIAVALVASVMSAPSPRIVRVRPQLRGVDTLRACPRSSIPRVSRRTTPSSRGGSASCAARPSGPGARGLAGSACSARGPRSACRSPRCTARSTSSSAPTASSARTRRSRRGSCPGTCPITSRRSRSATGASSGRGAGSSGTSRSRSATTCSPAITSTSPTPTTATKTSRSRSASSSRRPAR